MTKFQEKAEAVAADMKSEESFDLSDALKGASYPTDDVTIFIDGENAHALNMVLADISELAMDATKYAAGNNGGMADSPEKEEIDKQIEELEVRQKELIAKVLGSALTFTVRGAAPEQWKLIIKKWTRKSKKQEDLEDEQERVEWANEQIDNELISKTIVKITNAKGGTQSGAVSIDDVANLRGTVLQSEFSKLMEAVNALTFANGLFQNAIASDADFLSRPSVEADSAATSS